MIHSRALGGYLVPTCLIFQLNSPSLDLLRLTFYCNGPTHVSPAVKVGSGFMTSSGQSSSRNLCVFKSFLRESLNPPCPYLTLKCSVGLSKTDPLEETENSNESGNVVKALCWNIDLTSTWPSNNLKWPQTDHNLSLLQPVSKDNYLTNPLIQRKLVSWTISCRATQALTLYVIHNRLRIKIYCKWVAAVSAFDENQDIVPSMRLLNFLLAGWFTRAILLCKILEVFGTIWSLITAEPHAITWKDGLQLLSCCNRWTFLVEIEESDQDFKMFDLADLWFIRVHSYI